MITHESWQRIKEIFQSAQRLRGNERANYLNQACGDDASIREEVEALLTADESNDDFLIAPAYEFAASLLAGDGSEFVAGQKIGPYTILCPLGSGGMGQIYLAEDAKLRRKVAIKLIAEQFARDPRRVRRFEQEALAVSTLNHPNICVIYEVGTTENDRHFIAMEYIQGVTLREHMSRGPLPVLKALNIAIQVSAALASAHASGIVHRDIKPENIMLRPDGYVKVLDFGLAKLTEVVSGPNELSTNMRTEVGTLMGTVKYMSPEQLREIKVDERSDIWSLGVVLHEMVTGKTPFEKPTPNDTIAEILAAHSAQLKLARETPSHLREIMAKSLEKDSSARYQTVMKFASDLRQVQIRLQRDAGSAVDVPVGVGDEGTGLFTRLRSQAALTTELLFNGIRTHKRAAIFAGATGVLALLLLLPTATRLIDNFINPSPGVYAMKRLTNEGTSVSAAISPDGKWVAHAELKAGKQSLVISNTATSASNVIVPPMEARYLGVSFSRDNNYLYFTRRENDAGILYRLALPGNSPVKVKDGVDSPISLSPQGDRFVFVRLDQAKGYSIVLSNIDGSEERVLKTRQDNEGFSIYGLSWSPDGNLVVCPTTAWTDKGYRVDVVAFDVRTENPQPQPISTKSWFAILQVAWQADMSGVVISAREKATGPYQLWEITYPSGVVRRLTNDPAEYRGVSLAGKNILTIRSERNWELYTAKAADGYKERSVLATGAGLNYGLTWAGNDRIVYSSMTRELLNISRINPDGTNLVRLTVDAGDNYSPAATADGKSIVFSSSRTGSFNIWRMNANDGSDLKQLTFSDSNFYPSVSPDNRWVAYDNQRVTKLSIWRIPLEGGDATKVAEGYRMPEYSPDSQFIAARYDLDSGTNDIAIYSAEGRLIRNVPIPILEWQSVQWLSDNTLTYIKSVDGHSDIWSYDLGTGSTRQLTNFNRDQIFAYAWSPDKQRLAYQLGTYQSNVFLIGSDQ
jgi:eukaryotic-like serine/threonine-protein kinase